MAAQLRLALALAAEVDRRSLSSVAKAVAGTPRFEETELAGVPASVARPGRGEGPWPAIVVVPGVTRLGRRHPALAAVGRGLAAAGFLVAVVEPAGLSAGELTLDSVRRLVDAAYAVASDDRCRDGRVALAGVSGGATLALLAAADPVLAERVSVVGALAPCCDIEESLRLVTTGRYAYDDGIVAFETGDFFRLVLARSAVAWLEPGPDRDALQAHVEALEDYGADPLAGLRSWPPEGLGAAARAVVRLLANDDPGRFDHLFAALPESARQAADRLSPVRSAAAIRAPVELVVGREDKYLPPVDAGAFAEACAAVRLTVVDSLTHAVPRLRLADARDAARLDGAAVRLLRSAAAPSYSRR